jgi:hypothetical protein
MWSKSISVGEARVTSLTDGSFPSGRWGDVRGGAARVVVAGVPPDELNRVRLRMNPLLIQVHGKNVLVETGFWDRGGEKFESLYALDRDESVFSGCARRVWSRVTWTS